MKAQRRHELQHNVLDAKLSQLGSFIKRYANTITWVILIAAIALFISTWAYRKHSESVRQPQIDFENLTAKLNAKDANVDDVLTRLKALANQDTNRGIAAAASLAAAVNYADQALIARDQITRSQREASATELYNNVISKFADMPEQVAKAYFGLGELAEGKGEIETARSNYSQALKISPNGYPIKDFASRALTNLDKVASPVTLATTVPSIPTPGITPSSQPKDAAKPAPANVEKNPAPPANQDQPSRGRYVPIPRNPQ